MALSLCLLGCFILKKWQNWIGNSIVKELVPSIDRVLIGIADTYASKGEKVYGYFPFYRRFAILYVEYISLKR